MNLSTANQQVITSVDELKSRLGDHFVILFGSAVSGVMEPKLPMIYDVMDTFLEQASARLYAGSYQEKVVAGYARELVRGYHKPLLRQTKFENFIFDLQASVGKDQVDDLFVRVFSCTGKQYNNNHSALAFLLRKRNCLAALTTNFDNQVELCLPNLKTYIYPKRPKHIPAARNRPIYIKLHGDAPTRTYVATSPQLSQARSIDTYAFIEDLLLDQVVLVLGYSGTGDIDIAPHLGRVEKLLIWGDYTVDTTKAGHPNRINLLCDLSLSDPGREKDGRRNVLLDLATSYGWKPPATSTLKEKMMWEDHIVAWTQKLPLHNLRKFITSFMSWRTSWPHVHIAYLGLQENESYENKLEYALSTVQVAAYNSSERLLKSLLLVEPSSLHSYLSTIQLLSFTYWGKRHYQMALSTSLQILNIYEQLINDWNAQPGEDIKKLITGVAREYLETLLEVVNNERKNEKRIVIVRNSRAEYVLEILRKLEFETGFYLNRIAIMETRHWLGIKVSLEETEEFFDQCMAMQEWAAAALTAQFMLTLSYEKGSKVANAIRPELRKRKSSKLIIKVNARLMYERLNRRIPVQVLNFKAFTDILLIGVELIFAFKRLLWKLDRWANRVRVETGFLNLGKVITKKL